MLQQVESLAEDNGVPFRAVDVFIDPGVADEADLELTPEVEEWGLISQPWLYAIDSSGLVAAVFEGAVSDDEVEDAIDLISG